jgi:hypothetical protein
MNEQPREREELEQKIDRSRRELADHIDALDGRIKQQLDKDRLIHENAPVLAGVAAAGAFLIGWKAPGALLVLGAIGGAILAAKTMRERREPVSIERF